MTPKAQESFSSVQPKSDQHIPCTGRKEAHNHGCKQLLPEGLRWAALIILETMAQDRTGKSHLIEPYVRQGKDLFSVVPRTRHSSLLPGLLIASP